MAEIGDFARRLCEADHPHIGGLGPTPCGQHTHDAQRLWGLLGPGGTIPLGIILGIRARDGLPDPMGPSVAVEIREDVPLTLKPLSDVDAQEALERISGSIVVDTHAATLVRELAAAGLGIGSVD